MSSSNSFNICPRCGSPNPMSAKYCSRCGSELKLPEDPVVCHNCRTRNTPLANFCRNCGAELKVGYATKICARCGNEVPADQNVCTCGYVFAHTTFTAPIPVRADGTIDTTGGVTATDSGAKGKKEKKKREPKIEKAKDGKVYSHKGGRAFALVALILLLVFAYLVAVPYEYRPDFLADFDKGIATRHQQSTTTGSGAVFPGEAVFYPTYGYNMVMMIIDAVKSGSFGDSIVNSGGTVQAVIASLVVIFALAVIIHLFVCIVRLFSSRRSKRPNWLYLALAILTSIVVALIVVFNTITVPEGFLTTVAGVFKFADDWKMGYVLYAIPVYFWFFFLYSLIAKARVLKEATVTPTTVDTKTATK